MKFHLNPTELVQSPLISFGGEVVKEEEKEAEVKDRVAIVRNCPAIWLYCNMQFKINQTV